MQFVQLVFIHLPGIHIHYIFIFDWIWEILNVDTFRIMISALSFLLGYERIEDGNDSDDSSDEDDAVMQNSQFVLSREAVYKVFYAPFLHFYCVHDGSFFVFHYQGYGDDDLPQKWNLCRILCYFLILLASC